jgi:CubicO group peptidase (beta-lactamase class C family)
MRPTSRILGTRALLSALALATTRAHADRVDDYVRQRMAREHIPGLSLVVVQKGKIVKAKGYGLASIENHVPAAPETVYDLASTTKPFTATAILLLVQDGKLALDDKIGKFVENVPESWKPITIRHLLSHTSGIPDYLADLEKDFPNDAPADQIVKTAMAAPLKFAPGAKWSYSNTGFVVLGTIVKKVSGKTFDAMLSERVLRPLQMDSTFHATPDGIVPHRASGYLWYGGEHHNADFLKFLMTNFGDRGLLSSALDLAKWDAGLASGRVLSPSMREAMWTPTIRFDGGYSYEFAYGLGWFVKDIHGHRQISHPGGAPGTATILSRYPDDGLTVIILTNGGKAFVQALDLGIAKFYVPSLSVVKPLSLPPSTLAACVGYYNAYGSQLLKVSRSGKSLFLDDGGGVNNEFVPISRESFVAEESDRGFRIAWGAGDVVTGATLRLGKDEMAVQRIGPHASRLKPQSDPSPELSKKVESVLMALAQGGKTVETVVQLAPQARQDYSRGPAQELSGMRGISYLAAIDLTGRGIERHGAKVSRVLYYKLLNEGRPRFVLVYLSEGDLVTDQDVVRE